MKTSTPFLYSIILLVAACLLFWQNCQKTLFPSKKEIQQIEKQEKMATPQTPTPSSPAKH